VPKSTSSRVACPASKQHRLAAVERLLEHQRGVPDHGTQPLGIREQFFDDLGDPDRAPVVDLGEHLVLEPQRRVDLLLEDVPVEEVLHPDAGARHLVGVGRADAAAGGADLAGAEEALGHLVEHPVVGRDDVGIGAHDELGGVDPARLEPVDLAEEHLQVDDDTVADDRGAGRREDARGQQVQRVFLARPIGLLDDHRVAGVVAAVELHDVVDATAQQIGRLPLALIAPLGTDEHDSGHGFVLLSGALPRDQATRARHRGGGASGMPCGAVRGKGRRWLTVAG
jgi:hypothetical protein